MEEITDRGEELIAAAKTGTTTEIAGNVLPPTGRDGMLHPYSVTLTPTYATASDIVVKVNRWQNMASDPGVYKPPVLETGYTEGFDKLTIPVSASAVKTTPTVAQGPIVISLPFAVTIPAESPGFLIFAANAAGSGISIPGGVLSPDGLTTATAAARRPVERLYNIVDMSIASAAHATVEPLPNLQNFLRDGGTIYLAGPAGLVISEVMWGTDASLSPHSHSQWIEIKNVSGAPLTSPAGTLNLHFIGPHETLTAGTPVVDSVGTVAATGGVWNIFTRGLAGRTGTGEQAAGVTTVVAQQDVISMQRVFSDTAQRMPEAGNLQTSWAASTGPALNFDRDAIGRRIGSPGTEPLTPPPPTPAAPAATPAPSTPIAGADDIMITEIMVDTSSDRFPQWIEITHVGIGKASLNGWTMVVDNAIDGEVLGGGNAITLKLDGVELDVSTDTRNSGAGQSLLVVAWASGRKSGKIRSNGVLDVGPQLGQKGRYQLLSYEGFRITLVPPQTSAIATFGDRVGNLDEDWNILMLEGAKRSSMIRREMSTTGVPFDGTESAGWVLASATPLIAGPETYYGNDEDAGTPGYDAGGPLPVELSHFRPARDKQTGAVVITWATQSELNNAGFFIKRSNQRNGQFKVINPTLIPGAGTTSEKQMYTYTDATAQPNVVYYYQIEDVSLDGQRQTLTNGIRLKGHIGAAGKATTLWGELKSSNE